MSQNRTLTPKQCPHGGASAQEISYHSRYATREGIGYVFRCQKCRKTFCDRYGTAFYDLKTPEVQVQRAVQQIMEGLSAEAVARVEGIHPTTVQRWAERARQQAEQADQAVVQKVKTEVVELDELHSFAGSQHEAEDRPDDVGTQWVHCAMARASRLLLEVVVGPRTIDTAQELVQGTARRLVPKSWPLWGSDGWDAYIEALLAVFYHVVYYLRSGRRGRPKAPKKVPHPELRYGQLVKKYVGRRLVSVTKRVVFGVTELVPLAQISTAWLERLNGTLRLHVSPMHRKTRAFAKRASTRW